MATRLNPYLSFGHEARDAMEFYRSVFGGQLDITPFGAFETPGIPGDAEGVMHSQLVTPAGLTLMASDTPPGMERSEGSSISLSLSGGPDDEATLRGYWDGLAAGGAVTMPLGTAPWGDTFGMLTDRFGVSWMVSIGAQQG
jgi:PhnB protein